MSSLLAGASDATAYGAFSLFNSLTVPASSFVASGLGINPTLITPPLPFSNSFDFGVPFFFGRTT